MGKSCLASVCSQMEVGEKKEPVSFKRRGKVVYSQLIMGCLEVIYATNIAIGRNPRQKDTCGNRQTNEQFLNVGNPS